jgi:hypothetical protein
MRDLTIHSDRELSLNVFNEEYFYAERKNLPYLVALVNEEFHYTPTQMAVLIEDLAEEAA